jgi:KDO2-lipid IV(A) lauroyltransferase
MEFLARLVLKFIQLFPLRTLRRIGKFLGLLTYHLASDRRKTALANLDRAYGDSLSREEKVRIAKGSFINLVTMGLEFGASPALNGPIGDYMRILNHDQLIGWLKEKRPTLMLVPHMGNWEISARYFVEHGSICNAVTRKQKQPWVTRIVTEIRERNGIREIDKRNALRPVLSALRRNEIVLMLIDQYARKDAVEVQFFGHPAMTVASASLIALKTKCVVRVGACFRFPDGSFGGVVSEDLGVVETGDREADLLATTQLHVSAIEEYVRQHPEDWMWMHRRWKKTSTPPKASIQASNGHA